MLAVVMGLLQSMVDAMPNWIGQTFLHHLYDRLHALDVAPSHCPHGLHLYYSWVCLTPKEWLDLTWWEQVLHLNVGVQAYSLNQGCLGVAFGDGSGTGTGGTLQVLGRNGPCPVLEAWMGTWCRVIQSFSSNWHELQTLVHTLECEVGGMG